MKISLNLITTFFTDYCQFHLSSQTEDVGSEACDVLLLIAISVVGERHFDLSVKRLYSGKSITKSVCIRPSWNLNELISCYLLLTHLDGPRYVRISVLQVK